MSLARRGGFSLVEVLIGLVAGSLLAALAFSWLRSFTEAERERGERAGVGHTLGTATSLLAAELEPLGADSVAGHDLLALGSAAVSYRAQRGSGVACRIAPDTVDLTVDTAFTWLNRNPQPGRDSLLIYLEGDSAVTIDAWRPAPVVGVSAASCPGGAPGLRLLTRLDSADLARYRLTGRTVVRLFEVVALRLYSSGGQWTLGIEGISSGAAIQPFTGPFRAGGVVMTGLDRAGAPTINPPQVASLAVDLVGLPHRELAAGPGIARNLPADSVGFRVVFRNLP